MRTRYVNLYWPLVTACTTFLYLMTFLFLLFDIQIATIFLFALIAFWSRLPGVGIQAPFFILYQADLVDLFSMVIAINIGGIEGAVFTIFCNIGSRLCGTFPKWEGVINDAISQAVICMMIPLIYPLVNDVFVCMMIYTILRRIGFFPQIFFFGVARFVIVWTGATIVSFIINGFYGTYFGFFLDSILRDGTTFSWPLFFGATVIIFMSSQVLKSSFSKLLYKGAKVRFIFSFFNRKSRSDNNLIFFSKMSSITEEVMLRDIKRLI